jgi:tape measure domain-containing protein
VAYTADIQIAVRGATQITNLQRQLEATAQAVNKVNKTLGARGLLSNSINNLRTAATQAERAMRSAAAGTSAQKQAIDIYVKSLDAAERAENELTRAIQRRRRELGLAANTTGRAAGGRGGGRFGDVASNAIIGGAFPLLFGQGGGAATGGAIGGAIGGVFGGTGGFAGSLLGTLIGERAGRGQQVKELAADIGFTAKQTELLGQAFAKAGSDFDKFQESVSRIQGLSLSIEDQAKAIQLASALTEAYGGKIDKVTNAFTNALQTGKVTQATLNQLTSQGIPIQDALAKKYGVSRSALLQMAKDGKISVQDLINTLVDVGNKGVAGANKAKSSFDNLKQSISNLGSAFSTLGGAFVSLAKTIVTTLQPVFNWLTDRLTDFINLSARGINKIADLITRVTKGPQQAARAALQRNELPNLQGVVEILGEERVAKLRKQAGPAFMGMGVNTTKLIQLLKQQPEFKESPKAKQVLESFNVPAELPPSVERTKTGRKPPEDRTAALTAELAAIEKIAFQENIIRDLLFEGKEIKVVDAQLAQTLADIERDRVKALLNANYETEKIKINEIAAARTKDANLKAEDQLRDIYKKQAEEKLDIDSAIRSSYEFITQTRKQQDLELQYAKTYSRLISEGILPAEAERIANFDKIVAAELLSIENQIKTKAEQIQVLENQIAIAGAATVEAQAKGAVVDKLKEELDLLEKKKNAIKGAATGGAGKGKTDAQRLEEAITSAKADLNELTNPINQVTRAAQAMGSAFSQAFTGLVSGAMNGQEALASFFKGVGDHFMDMAAQMIAKLIEIFILQTILGFIQGSAPSAGSLTSFTTSGAGATASPSFGGGLANSFTGNFGSGPGGLGSSISSGITMPSFSGGIQGSLTGFAEGGLVTRPTMAMVGEGGEAEYIIPASKMDTAMARYSAGARGAGVIPNGPGNGTNAAGGNGVTVTYAGPTLNFNGDEYLPKSAVPDLINAAARQGAEMGQSKTIRTLQNSRSTRSRIGI